MNSDAQIKIPVAITIDRNTGKVIKTKEADITPELVEKFYLATMAAMRDAYRNGRFVPSSGSTAITSLDANA